ncbi:hypothetical protein EDB85DRAFT_1888696 [Lactarius pseudohatsudake]|nr:hypothetical protein EDB85DRAFT_1888696 [Lactarius pseudohatsudake]
MAGSPSPRVQSTLFPQTVFLDVGIDKDAGNFGLTPPDAETATKLANAFWTNELQRRFDTEKIPITAMSVHPRKVMFEGNVKLFKSLTLGKLINWGFSLVFISLHDDGYTPAWAAAARQVFEERDKCKGKYLQQFTTGFQQSDRFLSRDRPVARASVNDDPRGNSRDSEFGTSLGSSNTIFKAGAIILDQQFGWLN